MKPCTKCGTGKPPDLFPNNKRARNGKGSWCKAGVMVIQQQYFRSEKGKATLARGMKKLKAAGYYRFGKGTINALRNRSKARGLTFELTADASKLGGTRCLTDAPIAPSRHKSSFGYVSSS